jgi:hypothetical protein
LACLLDFRDSYYARRGLFDHLNSNGSTAGAAGCFTFRATFFAGARLGLALAAGRFVAFAALDTLRDLARLAAVPLRSTFDTFLRLAMIAPLVLRNDTTVQVAASYQTRVINRSPT